MTKFWTFRQNNSGGSFDFNKERGISVEVIIEANTADEASARAQDIGLYFDGCANGQDCPCCGDRWYDSTSYDKGDPAPSHYNTPIILNQPMPKTDFGHKWMDGAEGYIHYLDGRIVPYWET